MMALAENGSRCSLRRLLDAEGAGECSFDYSIKNRDGRNILHILVEDCDLISIKRILNNLKNCYIVLNDMDGEQRSPMMIACHKGFYEIVEYLQSHTSYSKIINWNLQDKTGQTLTELADEALKGKSNTKETTIIYTKMSKTQTKKKLELETKMHSTQSKHCNKISTPAMKQMNQSQDEKLSQKVEIIRDNFDDDLDWIQQMKIEEEEREKKLNTQNQLTSLVKAIDRINLKMEKEENEEVIDAIKETEKIENAQKLENIAKSLEKRRLQKLAAKTKITIEEKEENYVPEEEKALSEEIIWALTQEIEMAGQAGDGRTLELLTSQLKEEEEKMNGTWQKKKEREAKEWKEKVQKEKMERREKARKTEIEREEKELALVKAIKVKENQEKLAEEKQIADAIKIEIDLEKKKMQETKHREEHMKAVADRKKKDEEEVFKRLPIWKQKNILSERAKEDAMYQEAKQKVEDRMRQEEQWRKEMAAMEEERIKGEEKWRQEGQANYIKMQAELNRRAFEVNRMAADEERKIQEALQQEEDRKKSEEVVRKLAELKARKKAEHDARKLAEWEARQCKYEKKMQQQFEKQEAEKRILSGAGEKEIVKAQEEEEAKFIQEKRKILRDHKLACLKRPR